jgi:hypothetical protein
MKTFVDVTDALVVRASIKCPAPLRPTELQRRQNVKCFNFIPISSNRVKQALAILIILTEERIFYKANVSQDIAVTLPGGEGS